jgi:hypothetical protein
MTGTAWLGPVGAAAGVSEGGGGPLIPKFGTEVVAAAVAGPWTGPLITGTIDDACESGLLSSPAKRNPPIGMMLMCESVYPPKLSLGPVPVSIVVGVDVGVGVGVDVTTSGRLVTSSRRKARS